MLWFLVVSKNVFIKADLLRSINGFKKKMNQAVPHSLPLCFHTPQGCLSQADVDAEIS